MLKKRCLLMAAFAFFAISGAVASSPSGAADRLDIPAQPSSLASKTLLLSAARAGDAIVAVGHHGHVLVSADGGKQWTQSAVPVSAPLTAVRFPSANSGWAVGHDGVVMHSADGGKTWERQLDGRKIGDLMVAWYTRQAANVNDAKYARSLEEAKRFQQEGPSKPFLDLYFENERSGWAIGTFNMILKTNDGGKTWEPWLHKIDNDKGYSLHAIAQVGGDVYIVGELGLLLKLDRARDRFVALNSPYTGSLFGVTGSADVLYVYGLRGNIFSSRDRGRTWQSLKQDMESALVGGALLQDGRLVLITSDGKLLISTAGGKGFTRIPAPKANMFSAVLDAGHDTILLFGSRGAQLQTLPPHN